MAGAMVRVSGLLIFLYAAYLKSNPTAVMEPFVSWGLTTPVALGTVGLTIMLVGGPLVKNMIGRLLLVN